MRMAVTGGSGFIGRHVVAEARRRGHTVRSLAGPNSAARLRGDEGEQVQVDLRAPQKLPAALRDIDVVVHCAAAMGGDLGRQEAITVDGTRNLLAAMREAGVRDIVLTGSFAVYDYNSIALNGRLDEDSPLEANAGSRAPYIKAKQQQEELIRSADGVAWTIVRPGIVFGPGRTWFHHLGAQLPGGIWLCLAPESTFPIIHVQNCAEAIVLAAENRDARGTVLNLVDDELPRRGEYVAELITHERPKATTVSLSWSALSTMAKVAGVAGPRVPDLLNQSSLNARCKPLHYSNARAKSILGWTPRVDWRSGLSAAFKVNA